jgi:hypothetical protein
MIPPFDCCLDTERAKATAARMGVFSQVSADLGARTGVRVAAGWGRDGGENVAIVAWAGCIDPQNDGWMAIYVTRAQKKSIRSLVTIIRYLAQVGQNGSGGNS